MKEKLLLLGAGSLGRVVLEHVGERFDCAFLDDGRPKGTSVDGVPVIGASGDMARLYPEYRLLLVTIGSNRARERLLREAAAIGYAFPNVIVPSAYISPHAVLGTGCVVLNNASVQNGAHIGGGTVLCAGAEAQEDCEIGRCCLICSNSVVRSLSRVGDRASVGSTATVCKGARVPEDGTVPDGGTAPGQA